MAWRLPLACSALLLTHAHAEAQSCHEPSLMTPRGVGLRAAVQAQAASYDNERYQGEYQGLFASLGFAQGPVLLQVRAPWYRIVRNGLVEHGPGDVVTFARLGVLHDETRRFVAGPALALSAPTGDADLDLGMGHVMLTPGLFVALDDDGFAAEVVVSYSSAVGAHDGHHHGADGRSPIVNPMNRSETQAAIAIVRPLAGPFSALLGGSAAVPVGATDGTSRAALRVGGRFTYAWHDSGLELGLPLVGAPFGLRLTATLGASF